MAVDHLQVVVEHDQLVGLADDQAADVGAPQQGRRCGRHGDERLDERDAETDRTPDGGVEGERAAGERPSALRTAPSRTSSATPASSYLPSGRAAAAVASVARTTRERAAPHEDRTTSGATWCLRTV